MTRKLRRNNMGVVELKLSDKGFYTESAERMRALLNTFLQQNGYSVDIVDKINNMPQLDAFQELSDFTRNMAKASSLVNLDGDHVSAPREMISALKKFYNLADVHYCMVNSKRFAIDVLDLCKFNNKDYLDNIDDLTNEDLANISDAVIELMYNNKFLNIGLKLIRPGYVFEVTNNNNKEYQPYALGLVTVQEDKIETLLDFFIVPELFPRLYISMNSDVCDRCKKCYVKRRTLTPSIDIKSPTHVDRTKVFCRLNKLKMFDCRYATAILPTKQIGIDAEIPVSFHTLANVLFHIARVYKNRGSVVRANGKHRELQDKSTVSIPRYENNAERVIPLKDYVKYERRESKDWQGGHHKPPVEHNRREHVRRLFNEDGTVRKVIQVKGSVVNKNKNKPIYKVD